MKPFEDEPPSSHVMEQKTNKKLCSQKPLFMLDHQTSFEVFCVKVILPGKKEAGVNNKWFRRWIIKLERNDWKAEVKSFLVTVGGRISSQGQIKDIVREEKAIAVILQVTLGYFLIFLKKLGWIMYWLCIFLWLLVCAWAKLNHMASALPGVYTSLFFFWQR